ncbi:MAG: PilW family protein [Pseudomonas stutzeri]|nr:PilW family protein [Stutzerimonas stutzeri]
MNSSKAQAGLSIVELLVALVISMLLMTGVVQVFLASKQTYASNEAASRLQENGRFALEFIAQSARHAGYVEVANNTLESLPRPVMETADAGCDGTLCSSQGIDGNPDASDSIAFSFQPRLLDGARRDCLGNTNIGGSNIENTDVIVNHFFIENEGTGESALACNSRHVRGKTESTSSVLVEGIDALQVQYGIGTTGSVTRYVSADRVDNWNNVLAVRIAVLANSIAQVNPPTPADRQYVLLDAAPLNFADGKARQVFTTTIKLRNTGEP